MYHHWTNALSTGREGVTHQREQRGWVGRHAVIWPRGEMELPHHTFIVRILTTGQNKS